MDGKDSNLCSIAARRSVCQDRSPGVRSAVGVQEYTVMWTSVVRAEKMSSMSAWKIVDSCVFRKPDPSSVKGSGGTILSTASGGRLPGSHVNGRSGLFSDCAASNRSEWINLSLLYESRE
jgi:hypothetical protein